MSTKPLIHLAVLLLNIALVSCVKHEDPHPDLGRASEGVYQVTSIINSNGEEVFFSEPDYIVQIDRITENLVDISLIFNEVATVSDVHVSNAGGGLISLFRSDNSGTLEGIIDFDYLEYDLSSHQRNDRVTIKALKR
ncbi:MAG: hypothetical protein ACK4ND_19565 [Cytophagaceae bacterium]